MKALLIFFISFNSLASLTDFPINFNNPFNQEPRSFTRSNEPAPSVDTGSTTFYGEMQRQVENRIHELQLPDTDHSEQWLYGICLHEMRVDLFSRMRPDIDPDVISDSLISLNTTEHDELETIDSGICNALEGMDEMNDEFSEMNQLVSNSFAIVEQIQRESITRQDIAEVQRNTEQCQQREQEIHMSAMQASQRAYTPAVPDGYRLLRSFEEPSTGFSAQLVQQTPTPEGELPKIMLVIRGTDERKDWTDTNINYGYNQFLTEDDTLIDYRSVFRELMPYIEAGNEITFTGHSLGGGLAQAYGYYANRLIDENPQISRDKKKNLRTVTFGAFGAGSLIQNINSNSPPPLLRVAEDNFDENGYFSLNQTHYRINGDPVSEVGYFPYGQRRTMYVNNSETPEHQGFSSGQNHLMPRMNEWIDAGNTLSSASPDDQADQVRTRNRLGSMFAGLITSNEQVEYDL